MVITCKFVEPLSPLLVAAAMHEVCLPLIFCAEFLACQFFLECPLCLDKASEGRDWYHELSPIVKGKFDTYKTDYANLSRILKIRSRANPERDEKGALLLEITQICLHHLSERFDRI